MLNKWISKFKKGAAKEKGAPSDINPSLFEDKDQKDLLFINRYTALDASSVQALHTVGVHFDDARMTYVLLKKEGEGVKLKSYKTLPLRRDAVVGSKIVEMDTVAATLLRLARGFERYSRQFVVSLPQNVVTLEYFSYDPKEDEETLEEAAEAQASRVASLDQIYFDFYVSEQDDEENDKADEEAQPYNNVILAIAKIEDVDSRIYLSEITGLHLQYVDVGSIARQNAYSYWINNYAPEEENDLIAVCDIGDLYTQITYSIHGRILHTSVIDIGARDLLESVPDFEDIDAEKAFSILRDDFDFTPYEEEVETIENKLSHEILRSVRVFYSQNSEAQTDVTRMYLTGIGAKVLDMSALLEQVLEVPVEVLNPVAAAVPSDIARGRVNHDAYDLTTAFGLALRGFL